MDLQFIVDMYIPIVMVICLCVGFIMKRFLPTDNKWIPLILMILGAVIACIYNKGFSIDHIAAGMVTGLASTGLHQVFKQLIDPEGDDDIPYQTVKDFDDLEDLEEDEDEDLLDEDPEQK